MKKILTSIIVFFSFFITVYAGEFEITSKNVILYNMNEDSILYEENAYEKVSIASLTKIMTTLVAIENIQNFSEEITIIDRDFDGTVGYSEAGFKVGDNVTINDLLYGIMLPSGADAVNAIVRNVSGNEAIFVELMNQKAREIGLVNTHFSNPIGKDDDNNYSTAYDVALLLKYALQNEYFKKIFTTKYYEVSSVGLKLRSTLTYYSQLDTSLILGSKSGFTKQAGRCLASISHLNGVDYLLVVLKSDLSQNYNAILDSLTVYDYYSSNYSYQEILNKNDVIEKIPVKLGKKEFLEIKANDNVSLYLKNEVGSLLIYEYEGIDEISSKIRAGDKLGRILVFYEGNVIYTMDVFLNEELQFYHPVLYILGATVVFFLILIRVFKISAKAT